MGLSPAQFLLRQVITGRAAGGAIPAPEAISLSSQEVAEDAANGTLIGALLTAGGTAPYVYTLESDPDSLLAIDSDRLEVGDSFASVESYGFTVRTTDVNSQTFDQEFTLTVVPVIENGSGIGEDDGEIVVPDPEDPETDQGGYEEPPVQQNTNEGLKINGKNSGSATFLKDWGAPVPGAVYTMRYTADWSLMGRQGREAAVGFAFKSGNSFHLASLRGNGQVSTSMLKSKVYGDFRKANQFTITNDGAAAHGTKDGPNWLRIAIAQDGETYTLSTSANGSAWTEAYAGAFPAPLAAADDATQFGPAGYFSTQDKGVFAIVIESFEEEVAPAIIEPPPTAALSVVAVDVTKGWTLYERSPDTQRAPASLVKMAVALILVRRKSGTIGTDTATVTSADVTGLSGHTLMGLTSGDVLTYEDLLYGMLLPSGSDAAMCIARNIGTEIFNETGTGNTGVTRFVEAMNELAAEMGLSNTVFATAHGVSTSDEMSARDAATLAGEALLDLTIQPVSASASRLITITGANARTFTVNHTSRMQSDANVLAGKTGTISSSTSVDGADSTALAIIWEAPNGNTVAIAVLRSTSASTAANDRYLDMRGIVYQMVQDFSYLDSGSGPGTDAEFASVVLLAGADSGFVDESIYGRTLTANGATQSSDGPLVGSHSFEFDGTNDRIEIADAAELSMGASDWAVEFWLAGTGVEPGLSAFVSKYNTGANQREWSVQWDNLVNQLVCFVSTNGTAFSSAAFTFSGGGISVDTFFNGAKRHVLARRSGTEVSIYVNGEKGSVQYNIGASAVFAGTAKVMIGARATTAGAELFVPGKIDEVRVTNGHARQTGTKFTPVPTAYPRS